MQQVADSRTTVRISHHYAASLARVFDAWLARHATEVKLQPIVFK